MRQSMLIRFDPFREMDQLLRQTWQSWPTLRSPAVPIDAYRHGDEFIVEMDLPGVDRDSIDVTVERNVLEVTAQRAAGYGDGDDVIIGERTHGRVTRQLYLGEGVDADGIRASYQDGVLTVVLPVAEAARPVRIEVTAGAEALDRSSGEAVEAGAKAVGAGV